MASYRGHLTFSTGLGLAYGGLAFWFGYFEWGPCAIGGALTALSGLLPDLDSDSGVPVRTLFGVAAVAVPLLLIRRLIYAAVPLPQMGFILLATYLFIRYGLSAFFKKLTVHRGMFHSIPGMLITGLLVFLIYHDSNILVRYYLAGGAMLGFLSHLVLDELCSVNMVGVKVRLNKFAGSALKFSSSSITATAATYLFLFGLLYLAAPQFQGVSLPGAHPVAAEVAPQADSTLGKRWLSGHWPK